MLYLEWDELNPKKPVKVRLEEAVAAYQARFGTAPNVILVNEADASATHPGCAVQVGRQVRKDCYQVGRQD